MRIDYFLPWYNLLGLYSLLYCQAMRFKYLVYMQNFACTMLVTCSLKKNARKAISLEHAENQLFLVFYQNQL